MSLSAFTAYRRLVLLSLGAAIVGCGGPSDRPPLGRVTGTVKLNGTPLAKATVEFTPEKGRGSVAVTDDKGYYDLRYTADAKGAILGRHKVRITTARQAVSAEGGSGQEGSPERIPPKYNTATELAEEVKAGSNQFDYDLKSGGETFPTKGEGTSKAPDA